MKTTLYFFIALFCFGNVAMAQTFKTMSDSKTFQEKLHEVASKTTTLQSDFVQIKHLDVLSENIETNGKLYYKADNNLRWEYTDPLEYLIIMKQGKVSIKDEGKVSSYDLSGNKTFAKINEMIISSMKGDLLVDQSDYKYVFKESSATYLVEMYPKEKKVQDFLKNINIYFSKKDYTVQQVKMIEQSGDYTVMKFKNQKINASLSDKTFIIN